MVANSISVPNSPKLQKTGAALLAAGGITVSILAAKSVIVIGSVAVLGIPVIGLIIGLAMVLLGGLVYLHARHRENNLIDRQPHLPSPEKPTKVAEVEPLTSPPTPSSDAMDIELGKACEPAELIPTPDPVADAKAAELISSTDQYLTASNMVQWALIGATYMGVAPTLVLPLSILSGVGSEIATFCMLPKDASWLRKAMSIPLLSKLIINYNPMIGRILHAFSIYTLAQNTCAKLGKIVEAGKEFSSNPVGAIKAGAMHLFNLVSGVTFAADSAGLIRLAPNQHTGSKDKPCDPLQEKECEGPLQRKIRMATVYDNSGDLSGNRQKISDKTTANHREYADKWNLAHDVVDKSLVSSQCRNPLTEETVNCSPFWNKIKYFKDLCDNSTVKPGFWSRFSPLKPQGGKVNPEDWAIYLDDDAVVTNLQINPSKAIDQLRNGEDTSFIIATEGKGTRHQPGAVNTGVMIVRMDPKGCGVIDRIWAKRNTITSEENERCPTFGLCFETDIKKRNGDEQGATDEVIWEDPKRLMTPEVTRVLARDATHPLRGHVSLNTLHRGGCVKAQLPNGNLGGAFSITNHDLNVNPEGIWREGDWIVQTAGYPMFGQDLSHKSELEPCIDDPSAPLEPIRLKKVNQLLTAAEKTRVKLPGMVTNVNDPTTRKVNGDEELSLRGVLRCSVKQKNLFEAIPLTRRITFGTAYDNGTNKFRDDISEFVNANHAEYTRKMNIQHEVVSGKLVGGLCTNPIENKAQDCAAYWNKIEMLRKWLNEPRDTSVDEEWRVYLDDDMLVMNMEVDPSHVLDQLREGNDTSVIVAKDVVDWQRDFFGSENPNPEAAVNTGVIIVRKDKQARAFIEEVWKLRNTKVYNPTAECPTIGICNDQSKSMQEQEAMAMVLRSQPSLKDDVVSVVAPRDVDSLTRAGIAINTFYRDGCFVKTRKDGVIEAFSYRGMDRANPSGAFHPKDWLTQTAGVPLEGKEPPYTVDGGCRDRAEVGTQPVRLNKLKELYKSVHRVKTVY